MVKIYDAIANDQYYTDMSNMMIFPGNHDTERIADILNKSVPRQKIVMAMMATLRGIPQILYADELMAVSKDRSWGHGGLRIDFPLDWKDDPVAVDVHDYTRTLFNWRKTASAVHNGNTIHFLRRDNTYAYFRYDQNQSVFVYINNSRRNQVIPWADYAEFTVAGARRRGACSAALTKGTNVVTGETVDFSAPVKVGPRSVLVVDFNNN